MSLFRKLEYIYSRYNQRQYVNPDPLLFLYDYNNKKDIEIAGLLCACLAYGRVDQIMKAVRRVLGIINPFPFKYLTGTTKQRIARDCKGFKYRFARDIHLTHLLCGIKDVLEDFSSIENCFCEGWSHDDDTLVPGLNFLYSCISNKYNPGPGHLFADPGKKSACKRSHLFLRWMVRKDDVDPGVWIGPSPSQLIVPLDTHMYKTGVMLGFTKRKSQDIRTAIEITGGFRKISRHDPVKYDFSLTRFGIRKGLNPDELNDFFHDSRELI